jgi:hypothetical protein
LKKRTKKLLVLGLAAMSELGRKQMAGFGADALSLLLRADEAHCGRLGVFLTER